LGAKILVATLKHPSVIGVYWEDNSRILGFNCADITPKVPLSLVV
jgi:hypothetical protein